MNSADDDVANLIASRLIELAAAYIAIEGAIEILEKTATNESDAITHLRKGLWALTREGKEAARKARAKAELANDDGAHSDPT